MANVASGEHHMVINGDFGSMRVPAWSPDGTRIAIEMETDSGEGLYIVRADGSEKTQITRSSTICVVRWLGNERLEFTTFLGGM